MYKKIKLTNKFQKIKINKTSYRSKVRVKETVIKKIKLIINKEKKKLIKKLKNKNK